MTLLIAFAVIYGLGLSGWLYPLAVIIFGMEILFAGRRDLRVNEGLDHLRRQAEHLRNNIERRRDAAGELAYRLEKKIDKIGT